MKKVFIIIFIIVCAVATAQTIVFADANFKARLLEASPNNTIAGIGWANNTATTFIKIDANNDGEIQQSEVANITALQINSNNIINYISNITGIQYFTSLKRLNCSRNSISSISSTGLSNVLRLDLSYNQFTNIDLTGFSSLISMDIVVNQLTSINITGLPNLKIMGLGGNLLTNLNLTNLPNLELLSFEQNQISSVNLTNLPNLKALIANNNNLTTLDIRANPLLNDVACSNNPNLTSLYMKNGINQLTPPNSIYGDNWSNCPNLNYICADASEITALQSMLAPNYNMANITIDSACALGVEDFEKENVAVFPNPATNEVFFDNSKAQFDSVVIYNSIGQEVLTKKLDFSNQVQINLTNFFSGIYLIKFIGDNKTLIKKIIKK